MNSQLKEIREQAMKRLSQADTLDMLNDARVAFLGKKGELTAVLKSMKNISPEERPAFGQMVNETRAAIEKQIEETEASIHLVEQQKVNVTLRRRLGSDIDASCGQLRSRYKETS